MVSFCFHDGKLFSCHSYPPPSSLTPSPKMNTSAVLLCVAGAKGNENRGSAQKRNILQTESRPRSQTTGDLKILKGSYAHRYTTNTRSNTFSGAPKKKPKLLGLPFEAFAIHPCLPSALPCITRYTSKPLGPSPRGGPSSCLGLSVCPLPFILLQ